jgi:uncharacterized protein YggU (UPF0235/DUF167 family)
MKYNVFVKTGSSKGPLLKMQNHDLIVYTNKHPQNNSANKDVIKILKNHFRNKQIEIIKGAKSHKKIIEIL